MPALKRSRLLYPLTACAALPLAGYAWLGSLTRFMADDYCSAYYAAKLGLFRSIWYWYVHWSGRYTAFVFDWLVLTKSFGRYAAGFVPPLTLALCLALTVAALHLALGRANLRIPLALAATLLFVVLALSPDRPQSFYWLNGLRSYFLPLPALALDALLFAWGLPRLKSRLAILAACAAAFALTFLGGGLSETFAVLQFVLLAFLLGLLLLERYERPASFILAAGLAGALAAVFVIALAPGNAVRQASFPPSPGPIPLLTISMQGYLAFLLQIAAAPERIAALTGALLAAAWAGAQYAEYFSFRPRLILILAAAALALSFACFPPAVYGYSEPPPPRTLILPVFALASLLMAAAFFAGSLYLKSSSLQGGLLFLATLLILLSGASALRGVYQQRADYLAFARKWDAADAQILEARVQGQASVLIPAMDNPADLDRPTDNPKFWATQCYSEYYGIQVYGPPY